MISRRITFYKGLFKVKNPRRNRGLVVVHWMKKDGILIVWIEIQNNKKSFRLFISLLF